MSSPALTEPSGSSHLDVWPPSWTPAAVVFDCDGLLVDTEAQWVAVQDDYLDRHGRRLDAATRRAITGRSGTEVVATIADVVGKDPYQVGEELLGEHRAGLRDHLSPLAGAVRTVGAIAAKVPLAVASNSPRDMLDVKLEGMGLTDVIDASIAIEDVQHPKPAPDVYLEACRALGAQPTDSLGFEDSETGARAALAAGLHLIAVPSIPGQEPQAPLTLSSLEDPQLHAWIASWEIRR